MSSEWFNHYEQERLLESKLRKQIIQQNPDKYVVLPFYDMIDKHYWQIGLPNCEKRLNVRFPTKESAEDLCIMLNHGHALRFNQMAE